MKSDRNLLNANLFAHLSGTYKQLIIIYIYIYNRICGADPVFVVMSGSALPTKVLNVFIVTKHILYTDVARGVSCALCLNPYLQLRTVVYDKMLKDKVPDINSKISYQYS